MSNIVEEKRMNFSANQPTLAVAVGESGIGKTNEICKYAKKIREAGYPLMYFNMYFEKNYSFTGFLEQAFGTSNINLIIETINENFTKKGKVPTFIIDNVHYASINGKMDTGLLTFLNGQFYQELQMSVIMLASDNETAYEIQNCIFFPI